MTYLVSCVCDGDFLLPCSKPCNSFPLFFLLSSWAVRDSTDGPKRSKNSKCNVREQERECIREIERGGWKEGGRKIRGWREKGRTWRESELKCRALNCEERSGSCRGREEEEKQRESEKQHGGERAWHIMFQMHADDKNDVACEKSFEFFLIWKEWRCEYERAVMCS